MKMKQMETGTKVQFTVLPISSTYLIVICIKDAKSFFDVPREKLSPRPFRPRQDSLKVVKGFRSYGVHNILCATKNVHNYKMNT
jgi:hypothetical protein